MSTGTGTQGSQEETQRNAQNREGGPRASPCPALGRQEIEGSVRKPLHRNHCLSKRTPFLLSLEELKSSKYFLGFRDSELETHLNCISLDAQREWFSFS